MDVPRYIEYNLIKLKKKTSKKAFMNFQEI